MMSEESVEIPLERIDPDLLRQMIEEFVTREWSELADSGYTPDEKVAQVVSQLRDKRARIVYDTASETWYYSLSITGSGGACMKILAIIASPRGMQGNTGRLLDEVLAGVQATGAETEILSLKTLNVQPCVACDVCHKTGVCNIRDDYEVIKGKLLACDAFILASPNYIFSVSAQMKALFDRCNGMIHCMALGGKYAALVETSGGGGDEEVITYMGRFVNTLGASAVGGVGSPMAGIRTFPDEANLYDKARTLGRELCAAVAERRKFPEQEAFMRGIEERMSGLVDFMKEYWPFEREFWEKRTGA